MLYARLSLIVTMLFPLSTCVVEQCSRHDCTLPATGDRGQKDCILQYEGQRCGIIQAQVRKSKFNPPQPINLSIQPFRTDASFIKLNITWKPGNLSGNIYYLQGYMITIKSTSDNGDIACYKMNFTNKLQRFVPGSQDEQLTLYSDCSAGLNNSLQFDVEYSVILNTIKKRISQSVASQMFRIKKCPEYTVDNGNVRFPYYSNFGLVGEFSTISCAGGYILIGPKTRQCLSSGWEGNKPKCEEEEVRFEVFLNRSLHVNFEHCPQCTNFSLRLKNVDGRLSPIEYATTSNETIYMYENVDPGTWKACVSCSSFFGECCSKNIVISAYKPTTSFTTTSQSSLPTSTVTPTISLPLSVLSTNNPSTNFKEIIIVIFGCIGGTLLIAIVLRMLWNNRKKLEDSQILEEENQQSAAVENNNKEVIRDVDASESEFCKSQVVDDVLTIFSDGSEVHIDGEPRYV